MSYELCKCVLPKVKRKTQKPITPYPATSPLLFFSFLFLSHLTTTISHSPAYSLLIPSSTFLTLSLVLTHCSHPSLSLSHAPFSFSFLASVYFLSTVIPLFSLFLFPLDSRFPPCRHPNCFVFYDDLVIGLPDRVSFFFKISTIECLQAFM